MQPLTPLQEFCVDYLGYDWQDVEALTDKDIQESLTIDQKAEFKNYSL